jgi:hypothetical protein
MRRSDSHRKVLSRVSPAVLAAAILLVTGCSLFHHSFAALRSTEHFIPSADDTRILLEPGAEDYANKIASFLPSAIQRVEDMQYQHFAKPVRVYLCASRESFKKYYGADARAGVLTNLFVSPRIFDYGDDIAKKYLTHELSHLNVQQQIGVYRMMKLPMWFKEGLAAYVSDGGGAHLVTREQAIQSMRAGKCFIPNRADGIIFKKTPSDFNLKPHMFYRQSMIFIAYLKAVDEPGFRKMLLAVESGERLPRAIQAAYNKKLEELWNEFLYDMRKKS